jgi:hypothetical protein
MHTTEETLGLATRDGFGGALSRAKAEFLEMPGLKLTAQQARRLWAVDARLCDAVLAALVESRFLVKTRDAAFTRNA